jgi:hypothetical protein
MPQGRPEAAPGPPRDRPGTARGPPGGRAGRLAPPGFGGLAMLFTPLDEAGPARRLAVAGTIWEIAASRVIDARRDLAVETYRTGRAHRLRRAAEILNAGGAIAAATVARRSRAAAAASGLALLAASVLQRFGTFQAGVASTQDPKYVVVPQRERLHAADADRAGPAGDRAADRDRAAPVTATEPPR